MTDSDIIKKISISNLNEKHVSVLTQKFIDIDGTLMQIGSNIRTGYSNSNLDRERLKNEQPENIYNSIIAIWGDRPLYIINLEEDTTEEEGN